jgi:predicted DCC family thiol-disulfide oxidoreductase YuxK
VIYPYSDGSPAAEVAIFLGLLAVSALLSRFWLAQHFDSLFAAFARWLRSTGIFSSNIGLSAEVHRLDLIRVVIGCMAGWHYATEFSAAFTSGATSNALWFGVTAALCLCLTIGFLTPVVAVALLLLVNILVVNFTLSISIGSLAIAMCLIPMALAPAGHSLSIDSLLLPRSKQLRSVYALWGAPTVDRIQISRFLALVAFWTINAYSAVKHLSSETWLDGLTTGTILLFPMINPKYHAWADAFYAQSPFLYVMFSKFTTYGMLIWQLFLVPLVLASRVTRVIAICWGVVFFVFSAHVLAIKTLGTYEYVLFALVFWSRAWIDDRGRHSLMIFFDDRCNLCDRTVKTLSRVDLFHRLDFRPLSQNVQLAKEHGVSEAEALTDLVGVSPDGARYDGYRLYQRVAAIVLLAIPLWPLLAAGRALWVGPALYRFIADRRTRLFGVCQLGSHTPRMAWQPHNGETSSVLFSAFFVCFLILFGAYGARLPGMETAYPRIAAASTTLVGRAPLVFGMGHIDVFNEHDLKLYRKLTNTVFLDQNEQPAQYTLQYSEWLQGRLTQDLRMVSASPLYCSLDWGKTIASHVLGTISAESPVKNWWVKSIFQTAEHPTREDLLTYKYSPVEMKPVCITYTSIATGNVERVDYSSALQSGIAPVSLRPK